MIEKNIFVIEYNPGNELSIIRYTKPIILESGRNITAGARKHNIALASIEIKTVIHPNNIVSFAPNFIIPDNDSAKRN